MFQELEFSEGHYIFVINGVPRNWDRVWQLAVVAFWQFTLGLTSYGAPIEFIFRYMAVVR